MSDCKWLRGFIGQEKLVRALNEILNGAKRSVQPAPHMLFCGPSKCGKSTLAGVLPNELGTSIQVADAGVLKEPRDMMPFLTEVEEGSILSIRHIDRLPPNIVDFLTPALERFQIEVVLGEGREARTLRMNLKRFTLVGTTDKPSRIPKAIIDSGVLVFEFQQYSPNELQEIIARIAVSSLRLRITNKALEQVLSYSGGSVGNAIVLLKRLRNCVGGADELLTSAKTAGAFRMLGYSGSTVPPVDLAERLRAMDGTTFEGYVAEVYRRSGFLVEATGSTGDHGIDLVLRKDGQVIVVQCKRWNASVGEPVVREFFGALVSFGANLGFLVTTGQFTRQAEQFAEGKPLQLVDLDELMQMVGCC
jgi:Holliday junction resolvasome RuvABC ATP-dependent DNA helicase subunit